MVSGYDKHSPEPGQRPTLGLGWPFVAGIACAAVLIAVVWTFT